jgi:hypothetical protein
MSKHPSGRHFSAQPVDPAQYTPFFAYRRDILHCEGVPLNAVATSIGTPAYVYSRGSILGAYRRFRRAFHAIPHSICYSVKANSNLSVLRLLAAAGSSFDIVSGGELYRLRRIGVPGRRRVRVRRSLQLQFAPARRRSPDRQENIPRHPPP